MKPFPVYAALLAASFALPVQARDISDALGRSVTVPDSPARILCSGPGCVRLLSYLGATDLLVGVDSIELRDPAESPRAYAFANPHLRELPLIGEHRGRDNPELIVALDPAPELIFKTPSGIGIEHDDLQARVGIPVVALDQGDLSPRTRPAFDQSLRLMGEVLGREARAEAVIAFLDAQIAELQDRAQRSDITPPGVFVGGIAFQGAQGFNGTEPHYPPFNMLGLSNLAREGASEAGRHAVIAQEQIVAWDPPLLFLDVGSVRSANMGGLHELQSDPAYQALSAVQAGEVWGLLPNTLYHVEIGSVLANSWFIGSLLRPDTFGDIDPAAKAAEIEAFLTGAPAFDHFNNAYQGLVFQRVPMQ